VPESSNIARHLPEMAARQPDQVAIKVPRGRTRRGEIDYLRLSFAELDAEVDAWVARLQDRGVRRGDRVLVMVRQGLPLIAAASSRAWRAPGRGSCSAFPSRRF